MEHRSFLSKARRLVPVVAYAAGVAILALLWPRHLAVSASGSLDPGFGDGGIVVTELHDSDYAYAMTIQADGKIVIGGASNFGFVLVRYNADGTVDQQFGSGGSAIDYFAPYNLVYSLVAQPDGKILAGGYTQNMAAPGPGFAVNPVAARYNADGSPDQSFGQGGASIVDFGVVESARSLVVQSDGKIILAGNQFPTVGGAGERSEFALVRLNADGTVDTAFGAGGKTTASFNQVDFLNTALVQKDGKIIGVGDSGPADTTESAGRSIAIVRYNPDGSFDRSYGAGGRVLTGLPEGAVTYSACLQSDGKLIVTGASGERLVVARYNPDGSLDGAFGTGGVAYSIAGEGHSIAVQSDGKILVGGSGSSGSLDDFALLRLDPDGSPDASFGSDGAVLSDMGISEEGRVVGIDPIGRIIMAGYVQSQEYSTGVTRFALLAYQPGEAAAMCVRDQSSANVSFRPDGTYRFSSCGKQGQSLSGSGMVTEQGASLFLVDRQADRSVKITYNTSASTGKARIKIFSAGGTSSYQIKSNDPNGVCSCAGR